MEYGQDFKKKHWHSGILKRMRPLFLLLLYKIQIFKINEDIDNDIRQDETELDYTDDCKDY